MIKINGLELFVFMDSGLLIYFEDVFIRLWSLRYMYMYTVLPKIGMYEGPWEEQDEI